MKKEELMKLEGMTEELANKLVELSANEMRDMIPRSRLNEVIAERDNAKNEHGTVLKQLAELQKNSGDANALREQIQKLQTEAETNRTAHETQIKQLRIDNAIELALTNANALNTRAVKALLNGMDKAELAEDGTVKGLADQIKALQTADDSKFLFGKAGMKGAKHGESGNDDHVDISQMTYSEMLAYKAEHPDATF